MKSKIKDSWNIFNNYFKYGWWFWTTIAIGTALLGVILFLFITYTVYMIKAL